MSVENNSQANLTDSWGDNELDDPREEGVVIWDPTEETIGEHADMIGVSDFGFDRYTTTNHQDAPEEPPTPLSILKRYWGYDSFRPLQPEIIQSVLDGHDTLGLMPTGGGKSITFQVPAMILPGLTLVITPLISLMKDQVDRLRAMGIKATAIHSGMTREKILDTLDNCIYGRYKFLYVSPERLSSRLLQAHLSELNISLLVVDECHCICQWGYDFRPSYMQIEELRRQLPGVPVLALTATATPLVVEDICLHLGFGDDSNIFRQSFLRPNLSYAIRRTNNKEEMMLHILTRVEGSAIVYCRNRKLTKAIAELLSERGVSAEFYHAGLSYIERERRQNRWMAGETRVMVATNAFGMGIDKPDVRVVIHLMMPPSLEDYFQEAGRAGRDGQRAYAVALVGDMDASKLNRRIEDQFPPMDYVMRVYEAVCNFLQVGEGEGLGHRFDFDIDLFMRKFRMHPTRTHSAIEILQTAGLWTYDEEDSRSRLQITYTREALYQLDDLGYDQMIRTLLRTYTGLFTDYVFIDETIVAQKMNLSANEVYMQLTQLSKRGIVHYIPRKNVPTLLFHAYREDPKHVHVPASAYQVRKQRLTERIKAVEAYITDNDTCRNRLLLAYFGESLRQSCGECDVCLKHTDSQLPHGLLEDIMLALNELLTPETPTCSLETFLTHLPHHQALVPEELRIVLSQRTDFALDGDMLIRRTE